MNIKNLLVLVPVCILVACDWVDSTGRKTNSAPIAQISFADGQQGGATVMNELSTLNLTVSASDADGQVNRYQWRPDPVEQGALNQCAGAANFDIDLAAASLEAACSPTANCVVTFEQQLDSGEDGAEDDVVFTIKSPMLRAPVGVTYLLDTIDNEGGTGTQQSTFCFIAINEAPEAVDDVFTVLEGEVLTVTADSGLVNLLTNDVQDDHVSNTALRVLPEPVTAPLLASDFSLDSDGGFSYASPLLADRTVESAVDTFVYSVTDGTHVSNATVTVNVVATNDAPVQILPIPLQKIVAGVEFDIDLSEFFTDAEGSTLSFTVSAGTLPVSGALTLSPAGVLSGTAELIDVGSYTIEIIASDGSAQTKAEVDINVVENLPVVATLIRDQANELGEVLELDLSNFFSDPEDVPLEYSLSNSFNTATVDLDADTGLLEAVFATVGRYTIEVAASDGVTTPTSLQFVVVVSSDNVLPIFSGTITNRTARVGVAIAPLNVSTNFTDANNDVLTYSVTGTLPDGLSLSATGVLSGIPTEAGTFSGIRFVATDPLGKFARSNAVLIRVLAAVARPTTAAASTGDD